MEHSFNSIAARGGQITGRMWLTEDLDLACRQLIGGLNLAVMISELYKCFIFT